MCTYPLKLIFHVCACFTHTRMIQHTSTFLCQLFIFNIKYCTKIKYQYLHIYKQACFNTIIHFNTLIWLNIEIYFCASLSTLSENIVQNKTVTIYTTTQTHYLHTIAHFHIWQYFHTILSRFKNIFHQSGSRWILVES